MLLEEKLSGHILSWTWANSRFQLK